MRTSNDGTNTSVYSAVVLYVKVKGCLVAYETLSSAEPNISSFKYVRQDVSASASFNVHVGVFVLKYEVIT